MAHTCNLLTPAVQLNARMPSTIYSKVKEDVSYWLTVPRTSLHVKYSTGISRNFQSTQT